MIEFNAKQVKDDIVTWIREWFEINGKGCNAIVGISGGKDSSVTAALCVEALGKDRVLGVLMPNYIQDDIDSSYELCKHLDIKYATFNIDEAFNAYMGRLSDIFAYKNGLVPTVSDQTMINLAPRIRMTMLYAFSQSQNGRVANTCNLSEDWVGYATRYGDSAGDFSPLSHLIVTEVKSIGRELGLPKHLIEKIPQDGLCGKTDEDNLGFSYEVLDRYIRTGFCEDKEVKALIDSMHFKNAFKMCDMQRFPYHGGIKAAM